MADRTGKEELPREAGEVPGKHYEYPGCRRSGKRRIGSKEIQSC